MALKLKKGLMQSANVTPGPGAYETNASSVVSTEFTKKMNMMKTSRRNLDQSPSHFISGTIYSNENSAQRMNIRRMQNLSIPSIPSRFLTPVLKFDL